MWLYSFDDLTHIQSDMDSLYVWCTKNVTSLSIIQT
jgi:hypothetical protein